MNPIEAEEKYGKIVNGIWVDEVKWCINWQLPDFVCDALRSNGVIPPGHVYVNKDFLPHLKQAFLNLYTRKIINQLKSLDGIYCVRKVRGGTGWSSHSWACAIDVNAATNKLGTMGDMREEFGNAFEDAGLTWGRRWTRKDSQHMSLLGF